MKRSCTGCSAYLIEMQPTTGLRDPPLCWCPEESSRLALPWMLASTCERSKHGLRTWPVARGAYFSSRSDIYVTYDLDIRLIFVLRSALANGA